MPGLGVRTFAPAVIAVTICGLAGCGGGGPGADDHGEPGSAISYSPMGTTMTIDCGSGRSLSVGGSNNKLTVTGACADVEITGSDNRLTVDKITGRVSTGGVNNTVTYRDGNPTVSDTGGGNTVRRG